MKFAGIRTVALGLLAAIFVLDLSLPAAASTQDFSFTSFQGDYTLSRDSDKVVHIRVVERLVAVFPDIDQNHGIERVIPETYEKHSVHLKIASVTDGSGADIPFTKKHSNDNLVLRIGQADTYVHGRQTYVITYDEDHLSAKVATNDGVFMDVNGDQWLQTFTNVSAVIRFDESLTGTRDPTADRCFTGTRGSTMSDCDLGAKLDGSMTVQADRPLTAGETLTYEVGFRTDTFAAYTVPAEDIQQLAWMIFFQLVLPIGLSFGIAYWRWSKNGRDPKGRGVIVPEYTPPKDISVLGSSAVLYQNFRPSAITATILDLAVRGYLKIYEVKVEHTLWPDGKTYELELLKPTAGLRAEEQSVVNLVFGAFGEPGTRVDLKSLSKKLYAQAATLGKSVVQTVTNDGYFRSNPVSAKIGFATVGFILIGIASYGFSQLLLSVGVTISAIIFLLFSRIMPARTIKGLELYEYLQGLKMYMTVAEADRIKMMQAPDGSLTEKIDVTDTHQLVKLYEKLLPYAMVLGIEKQWIKQFAGLYDQSPNWYAGNAAFNAAYFGSAMSSFTSASSAGFTPPSSSSGGGSAGGGGGGGGGGGW